MNEFYSNQNTYELPVIPLRGLVVFPDMVLHFDVGRKKSVEALRDAMQANQRVFLVCQKDASVDDPNINDVYEIGVICAVKQMIRIPNSDNLRVVVEGIQRGRVTGFSQNKPFVSAVIDVIEDVDISCDNEEEKAYQRAVRKEFENYASLMPKISSDVIAKVISITDSGVLADYICSNTFLDYTDKQAVLNEINPCNRLIALLVKLKNENSTLKIEAEIQEKVQEEIDKNQREYFLREEMKVISETLGESDNPVEEADEYRKRVDALICSDEIKEKLYKECDRLMKMPSGSHEGTVVRNYIDKCL